MFEFPKTEPDKSFFDVSIEEPDKEFRDGRHSVVVTIGQPLAFNLEEICSARGISIPVEARFDLQDYEFHLVRFAVSIHPSEYAGAVWVDFNIDLQLRPNLQSRIALTDAVLAPIAYDIHPTNVDDEVAVESKRSISPTFKFKDFSVSGPTAELVLKYQRLEPRITAFGSKESKVGWRFTPGKAAPYVAAGPKELDLIVRRRRGTGARCKLGILGEGRTKDWTRLFFLRATVPDEQQIFDF